MRTYISYEVSKRLKEFLGESAPCPADNLFYCPTEFDKPGKAPAIIEEFEILDGYEGFPAYQLHDLLSKPFCEALAKRLPNSPIRYFNLFKARTSSEILSENYYSGGLSAVEKELMKMIMEDR